MLWLHHYEGEPRHCQSKHEYLPTAHSRQIIIYWTFYQEKPPLPIHRRIYFHCKPFIFSKKLNNPSIRYMESVYHEYKDIMLKLLSIKRYTQIIKLIFSNIQYQKAFL